MFGIGEKRKYRELEKALGHHFRDEALLLQALTHPSWRAENEGGEDNQRLEFLGDAVLGMLTAEYVYDLRAGDDEGVLTALRSQVASGKTLAELGRRLGLGKWLRLGRGEELSGGRDRSSSLADAFEALLGAVYLDGGVKPARAVFERQCAPRLGTLSRRRDVWAGNPKGKLQDLAQKTYGRTPVYTLRKTVGPAHDRVFRVEVAVNETLHALGEGASKRKAQAAAAAALLKALENRGKK